MPDGDYLIIIPKRSFEIEKYYIFRGTRPQRLASKACMAGGAQWFKIMYYTYILKSEKDEQLYIGFTQDLRKRIGEHNSGLVDATKDRRPLVLIYYEACMDKKKAIGREKYFKTGFGRRFLKNRIQ